MSTVGFVAPIILLIWLALVVLFIFVVVLVVRALLKYLRSKPGTERIAEEKEPAIPRALSETLKAHRARCGMTQEFVAESLGVSRQAVSKWESGASSPSTANLLAIAKLYGVSAGDLLREMEE